MEDVIKTILSQTGVMGAILIALGLYLLKKEVAFSKQQERWETTNDARHKEVVTLTQETVKAIAEVKAELSGMRDIVAGCDQRNGGGRKRGAV